MEPPEVESSAATETRGGPKGGSSLIWRFMRVLGSLALLAALYALSLGPALRLNKHGVISVRTLEVTYLPLSMLNELPGGSVMMDLIERYTRLWENPQPSEPEPPLD
jgi:hypothetical protein